ncbi:quinate permease [Verticillium alfalfae VaMs.102]|uniref:Quinate permease n=1 Tax=Verticillium alfalfae (strain VaMs.102 / ATCC MYA-4576 / FGSC 10136) TaxID=526221 RepID=C9SDP7_VERA1|nr:quinate permease [Verticillium alfalfae VaMs.102]EEY17167.1 quinate permease [Verticillium alfalfae VaMs.102]
MSKALGTFRAVYLVALCCVGSFLFAYDTGIVGGILTFPSFRRDFRYEEKDRATVGSNSTSLLQAGAFFACFFVWPFTARFGRRWSIVLASIIFNIGAVIQTINTHSLGAFYAARVISGIGVGMATVIIPMYSAEMAPKNIRGTLGSIWAEILAGIEEEDRVKSGVTWKELLQPINRWRVILIIALQIGVQLTGNTSMAYYAPQIFSLVGAGQNKLLLTGFFGVCKVVACLFFLLFLVERIGRRGSLMLGAFLMGMYMLIVAVLTVTFPPNPDQGLTPPSIASLTMIYLEAMSYNISWGPVPWVYMGEIFPTRIREAGIAIGTSTQWLFNFVFSQVTPHAVENLGWRTFLMFAIFNWALVVFVWFFIKETKGKSLEEMETLFARQIGVKDHEAAREGTKVNGTEDQSEQR